MAKSSSKSTDRLAADLARELERAISSFPSDFFDSFVFTSTGNNLTHPLMLGELARIMVRMPKVRHVGIDVRFNSRSGIKFQPDLVAFDKNRVPLFYVDYESPNSSDARVPGKDIRAYQKWQPKDGKGPYIVITTLPNREAPKWELRWTAEGQYNRLSKGQRDKVRKNPFIFWREKWKRDLRPPDLEKVVILNIDRSSVLRVRMAGRC